MGRKPHPVKRLSQGSKYTCTHLLAINNRMATNISGAPGYHSGPEGTKTGMAGLLLDKKQPLVPLTHFCFELVWTCQSNKSLRHL